MSKLQEWMESLEYLPKILRDFHDQKNLFKCMHFRYENQEGGDDATEDKPNWRDGHVYVIDWFLWYMARRGYTLQKTRKKLDFEELDDIRKLNPIKF